ncbi:hypothetical protein ACN42_g11814, partial [Penicillium freii]
IKSHNLDRANC